MKKLFQIVGFLFSILLIFFFLQYSNYAIFPMHIDEILDCSVENGITSTELSEISKENNITTFTITYHNTSFFDRKIHFQFLNINQDDQIRLGVQKRLLPSTQITYSQYGDEVTYIQKFWVLKGKNTNIAGFMEQLKPYSPVHEQFEPVELNLLDILNLQNLYFFGCAFIAFFFSNFIGLRASSEKENIFKFCNRQILYTFIPYSLMSCIFGIYIGFANFSLLFTFIITFMVFGFILLLTHIVGAWLAYRIVQIIRSPHKARRSLSLAILSVFSLISVYVLAISSQNIYFNIMDMAIFNRGVSIMEDLAPAYITTAKIPDEVSTDQLLSIYDEIDNQDIYHYAHPTSTLWGYRELHSRGLRKQMLENPPVVRMSYNMLKYIKVYGSDGVQFYPGMFDQGVTALLIPEHLKDNAQKIAQNFYGSQNFDIYFIQSNQEHFDILDPRQKVVNAVYMLTPTERDIYYTNGEVLFSKGCTADVVKKLHDYGFDQGTISLNKLSTDYEMIEDDMELALICDGLSWVMAIICCATALFCVGSCLLPIVKKTNWHLPDDEN